MRFTAVETVSQMYKMYDGCRVGAFLPPIVSVYFFRTISQEPMQLGS